jgi:hypothetical protein
VTDFKSLSTKLSIGMTVVGGIVDGIDNYQSGSKDQDTATRAAKAVADGVLNIGADIAIGAGVAAAGGLLLATAPAITSRPGGSRRGCGDSSGCRRSEQCLEQYF